MASLVFLLLALSLGTANPTGPTTAEPTESPREDLIKTAIDNNVQWLLKGTRDGSLQGPNWARAMIALFLAKPGYFSANHEIGQELKYNITQILRLPIFRSDDSHFDRPSLIPSEELALYVQALEFSCQDPRDFIGRDLLSELWRKNWYVRSGVYPYNAMLALCDIGEASPLAFRKIHYSPLHLTGHLAFDTMSIACLEPQSPWNVSELDRDSLPNSISGHRHYPPSLIVEKLRELLNPENGHFKKPRPASVIAAMQTLLSIRRLRESDLLQSAVDFLLKFQDEDGSWGQSALNSLLILPILSQESFLNVSQEHCPVGNDGKDEKGSAGYRSRDYRRVIDLRYDDYILLQNTNHVELGENSTLYDRLTANGNRNNALYRIGRDGKPYLTSLLNKRNYDANYCWLTFVQILYPKKVTWLLDDSHADIILKPDRRYILWYSQTRILKAWENPNNRQ